MESEVASMGYETAAAHFIDRDQARSQIETCEAQRYLKIARSFYRLGSFTKAFLFAVRARRIAKEKVAPDS